MIFESSFLDYIILIVHGFCLKCSECFGVLIMRNFTVTVILLLKLTFLLSASSLILAILASAICDHKERIALSQDMGDTAKNNTSAFVYSRNELFKLRDKESLTTMKILQSLRENSICVSQRTRRGKRGGGNTLHKVPVLVSNVRQNKSPNINSKSRSSVKVNNLIHLTAKKSKSKK